VQAKEMVARLPSTMPTCIIEEIGKEISGSGMDTNVVGRKPRVQEQPQKNSPRCASYRARPVGAQHGHAAGLVSRLHDERLVKTRISRNRDQLRHEAAIRRSEPARALRYRWEILEAALSINGTRSPETGADHGNIRNTLTLHE